MELRVVPGQLRLCRLVFEKPRGGEPQCNGSLVMIACQSDAGRLLLMNSFFLAVYR